MRYVAKSVQLPLEICAETSTNQPIANGYHQPTTITMATAILRVIDPLQSPPNPASTHWIDRGQFPEQADMFFSGVERVYCPQNAPLLW
jgi:hypothetical protein